MLRNKDNQSLDGSITKPSLEGVRAKFARAMRNISEFEEARKIWRASMVANPPISLKEDPSPSRPTFVLTAPAVDSEISLIIGDCVHNLRVCLDHLIGQFALKDGHDISKHSLLAFPACVSELTYINFVRTKVAPFIKNTELLKAIDATQPYHRQDPESDPLWVLSELDKIDKHRKLVVIAPNLTSRGMLEVVGSSENVKEDIVDPNTEKDLMLFQVELWPSDYASAKEAETKALTLVFRADAKLVLTDTGLPCDGWTVRRSLDLMSTRVAEIIKKLSPLF